MTSKEQQLNSENDGQFSFDEINGNWEEVRQFLDSQVRGDLEQDVLTKSIEANALAAQIALFGGSVQAAETEENRGLVPVQTRGGSVVRVFWWGFHIQISHEDVQWIISAADASAFIGAIINRVPPKVRPFLSVLRIFLQVSKAVLQALDRGRGVYVSMSWFAPGVFVPTSV